jgi:hypothetical protein
MPMVIRIYDGSHIYILRFDAIEHQSVFENGGLKPSLLCPFRRLVSVINSVGAFFPSSNFSLLEADLKIHPTRAKIFTRV